jgi:hypothetical protein
LNNTVLRQLLDPQNGTPYAARAELVTRLGLPASLLETAAAATNAVENIPATSIPTNSVAPVQP